MRLAPAVAACAVVAVVRRVPLAGAAPAVAEAGLREAGGQGPGIVVGAGWSPQARLRSRSRPQQQRQGLPRAGETNVRAGSSSK